MTVDGERAELVAEGGRRVQQHHQRNHERQQCAGSEPRAPRRRPELRRAVGQKLVESGERIDPLVVVTKLMENGLLTPPAGPNTFRLLPPLNVAESEIDEALAIVKATLESFIIGS